MSSLPKVAYVVISNFSVSFEISCGYCNLSKNTLRLINKIDKCRTFREKLVADFVQTSSTIAYFLFLQGSLGTRL